MAKQAGEPPHSQVTIVATGSIVEGNIRSVGDFRVAGQITGKLDIKGKAVVAKDGTVNGEIKASNALVAGTVDGNLTVSELLHLESSAKVTASINTARLVVEEGAILNGECQMGQRGQINIRDTTTTTKSKA